MSWIALVIALPVALAGGWYLVNPNAAARLAKVEGRRANTVRVQLRRANGVLMLLAGVTLYFAISRTLQISGDPPRRPGLMLPLAWIALVPMAGGMLLMAWLDMRLTRRMKRKMLETIAKAQREKQAAKQAAVVFAALTLALAGCDRNESVSATDSSPSPMSTPTPQSTRPATLPGDGEDEPQQLPTTTMQLGDQQFTLQVANEGEERRIGLMWVRELGPNEGMIFVFPESDWRGFWMENTLIELDLIFVTETGRVLNVEGGVPLSRRSIDSAGRAKYIVEIARGRAQELGIKRGTVLTLPEGINESVQ